MLLFPKGARLSDPDKLFNVRLKSTDVRAIEFKHDDTFNKTSLVALVTEAMRVNNCRYNHTQRFNKFDLENDSHLTLHYFVFKIQQSCRQINGVVLC